MSEQPAAPAGAGIWYEDFPLGHVFTTPAWEATPERIVEFAKEYDPQYFHLDPVKARESIFRGLASSGFQTAAVGWALALRTGMFDQCPVAGIGIDELRWLLPVLEGDLIRLEFSLLEGTPSRSKPELARTVFLYTMKNQRDETVLTMKLIQLLRRRPA